MSFYNRCKKYVAIAAIFGTIGVSYVYITENRPNAYEVCVGDKVVAYIKEDNGAIDIIKSIGDEVEKRFGSSELRNLLTLNKAQVANSFITDKSKLKKAVINNSSIQVEACALVADGKELVLVGNENEGNQVLEKIKKYYSDKSGMEVKESKIKNKITYSKKKTVLSKVQEVDSAYEAILEANIKLKTPVITVVLTGNTETKQTISAPTTVTYSNTMLASQSKLSSSGKDGEKLVTKEVVMENNKLVSSKILSEKVLTAAQAKIIVKGNKAAAAKNTFLASPSRGAVSSIFGMRWGRMHEGIDIAAPMGEPIKAALDGSVTYAGWMSGYGNFIKIKHAGGVETAYGHCSNINVKVGQSVKKGQVIGAVGSTGNSTGPHLHFEVLVNGQPKNPTSYLTKN